MESVDLSTEDESFTSNVDILICPECSFIVNSNSDFEVEWFDIEDAKYFGYKAVENE